MNPAGVRRSAHETTVAAPAATVHRLISEVENWPRTFPATVHVAHEEAPEGEQRLRVWDTAGPAEGGDGGVPRSWGLRRIVQDAELRVNFELLAADPPLASLGGAWLVEPLDENSSRVRLLQEFRAADDDPATLDRIADGVARDAVAQLAALKENVELAHATADVTFSFEDSVHIDGSAKDVYAFIDEAGLWSERLPHVATVRLTEDTPGVQTLEMDTRAKDGSVHTTKSYRVTFPHHKIAYKQVTLPALMTLHTGRWTFEETPDGSTLATSQHTVTLNTANITRILGPHATTEDARAYVHTALSTNSRATLHHAKTHTETLTAPHPHTRPERNR
ncbi:cyclase [Streptomyces sp. QHH-9511]|uniref:aromatase/cyclase n=3 Tax=Streptomyces TaxID=1883 RepID=UPI0013179253|nr:aromatase/cyclase [Streptomyces sp. QHH-9511]QGZ49418.1 cyclase [Streptomyces sp. QHH-9511]